MKFQGNICNILHARAGEPNAKCKSNLDEHFLNGECFDRYGEFAYTDSLGIAHIDDLDNNSAFVSF